MVRISAINQGGDLESLVAQDLHHGARKQELIIHRPIFTRAMRTTE